MEAHWHVGDGQVWMVGMVGIVLCMRRAWEVEIRRMCCIHGVGARERRAKVKDIVVRAVGCKRRHSGNVIRCSEWVPQL